MPGFELRATSSAPVEEVWKLLFDPSRFPEWWVGIETVKATGSGEFTQWPTGYPDFPMPQKLRTDHDAGRVTVSCQVSDLEFVWQLAEAGGGTEILVSVALPEREAHRLETQRGVITASLQNLAELAGRSTSSETAARGPGGGR
jgi:uncharacterized protein YndB with AHSA1/START domain